MFKAFEAVAQWVLYTIKDNGKGGFDKIPIHPQTGNNIDPHNSRNWTTYTDALNQLPRIPHASGLGFVFTANDPFWFLDIDHCLEPSGQWSPLAVDLCSRLAGCGIEVSRSGTGLHIFGSGTLPSHTCKNTDVGLELYHEGRFVALTGTHAQGDPGTDASTTIREIINTYFKPEPITTVIHSPSSTLEDTTIIQKALQSRPLAAVFGNALCFKDLWEKNIPALAQAFPAEGREYDASSADAALAQHLCFWVGQDPERIIRLMHLSSLVRDKWNRPDYLPRTVEFTISRQTTFYQETLPAPILTDEGQQELERLQRSMIMNTEDQIKWFEGCVYITDIERILMPNGLLLNHKQFKARKGGKVFMLGEDARKTTRDAFEAFTQHECYQFPKVDRGCFEPQLPTGQVLERLGKTYVNVYHPLPVPRKPGDVAPFLIHLNKLLPRGNDAQILLSYMAACVQYQGIKFEWAPFIQGIPGNGKTFLTRCVAQAIGSDYVHWPKASKLAAQFNGWMVNKIFYAVEDIYTSTNRNEVLEELKPMITGGDGLEIESKGINQISSNICGNFMFNSNHKDGIRKTELDRRFCILYCDQQELSDLARCGMDGDYMPNLYNWAKLEDGFAYVTEYLYQFPIPEQWDPTKKAHRAPDTTSSLEAIGEGYGQIEQEILEAIEEERPGFCGGFISSVMVSELLQQLGKLKMVPIRKRKELLTSLGYIPHPGLPNNGRVNNIVFPDKSKTRLYVRHDSPLLNILDAMDITQAYQQSNWASTPNL